MQLNSLKNRIRRAAILMLAVSIFFIDGCSGADLFGKTTEKTTESTTEEMTETPTDAPTEEPTTEEVLDGWVEYGDKNIFYIEGEPADGITETEDGYIFFKKGEARTGWFWEDDVRYYASEDGILAEGPLQVGGTYYIFDQMGRIVEEDTLQESLGSVPINKETATGDFNAAGGGNDYDDKTIYGLSGYEVTESDREMLQAAIDDIEKSYTVGFMMINLYTGEGIAYNPDADFYSASAIKGPYVASLVASKPELKDSMNTTLSEIVMYSENEEYSNLRRSQGGVCLSDWYTASGIDSSAFTNYNYPRVSARILAKLWVHNYYFFNTDENGMAIRDWYIDPINSAIDFSVGNSSTRVESKAGWICEGKYIASNDAGIIYPAKGAPYLISVCSDIPANLEMLEPLCRILRSIYEQTN